MLLPVHYHLQAFALMLAPPWTLLIAQVLRTGPQEVLLLLPCAVKAAPYDPDRIVETPPQTQALPPLSSLEMVAAKAASIVTHSFIATQRYAPVATGVPIGLSINRATQEWRYSSLLTRDGVCELQSQFSRAHLLRNIAAKLWTKWKWPPGWSRLGKGTSRISI